MLQPAIAAAEAIKEIFELHIFGKPDVLLEDEGLLAISWKDETARYASGPYEQVLEIAKKSDGSLDRFWELLAAANLTATKPRNLNNIK